jgi:outer membrane protein OmpA-like peptidoglycan-associated protein
MTTFKKAVLLLLLTIFLACLLAPSPGPAQSASRSKAQSWVDRGLKISESRPNSDEEARCYRRALAADPNHASAHFNLAFVLDAQVHKSWHGAETSWTDLDKLYEALGHYASAASLDPARAPAYANTLRIGRLLFETPTHRPPDLHRLRLDMRTCLEALNRTASTAAQSHRSKLDKLVLRMEKRLAELKAVRPGNRLVPAKEISRTLHRRFTRGQSPYQGPRVPLMIQFDLNKANIRANAAAQLREMAEALKSDGLAQKKIIIEGHTDSQGGMAYNQGLSERRALSVKRYLVERLGLPASRLITRAYGETRPLQPNNTGEQRAMNRRVEFVNSTELDKFRSEIKGRERSGRVNPYDVLY